MRGPFVIREFGATAWGRDWLRLAEPTATDRPDPALPRARSLARNDRVHDLKLTAGRVTAVVADRGGHRVDITVSVWNDTQLERARTALAAVPPSADLPDDLHTAAAKRRPGPCPRSGGPHRRL